MEKNGKKFLLVALILTSGALAQAQSTTKEPTDSTGVSSKSPEIKNLQPEDLDRDTSIDRDDLVKPSQAAAGKHHEHTQPLRNGNTDSHQEDLGR